MMRTLLVSALCATATVLAEEVRFVQTAEKYPSDDAPDRLAARTGSLSPKQEAGVVTFRINVANRSDATIEGFGGAITDSVAHVFSSLTPALQDEVLEAFWGESGQRYTLTRMTIGSTDFSPTVYNYNEDSPGDWEQTNFSIDYDRERIIPLALRAAAVASNGSENGTDMSFLASPWSPPSWMKAKWLLKEGHMRNSAKPGLIDDEKVYKSYALYFSKYLDAYKEAGIPISRVTVQNEADSASHMFPVSYPACQYNGEQEGAFLGKYLGPRLRADHPEVQIFVHDDQKDRLVDRVDAIMSAASDYVDGVAYHWYGANLKNYQYLEQVHAKYPLLPLWATEATLMGPNAQKIGTTPWKEAQKYSVDIIGDLKAHSQAWIEWNVLLDSHGGPTCIGPDNNKFCTPLAGHCDASILADIDNQKLEYRLSYFHMAHFSRYLPKGSVVVSVDADAETSLITLAAQTPDKGIVFVVVNTSDDEHKFQLEVDEGSFAFDTMPGHSIRTYTL